MSSLREADRLCKMVWMREGSHPTMEFLGRYIISHLSPIRYGEYNSFRGSRAHLVDACWVDSVRDIHYLPSASPPMKLTDRHVQHHLTVLPDAIR